MERTKPIRKRGLPGRYFRQEWQLYAMLLLPVLLTVIYRYVPMFGIVMAFQNYKPYLGITGSKFVGLKNFTLLFSMSGFTNAIRNTVIIAVWKIVLGIVVPVLFSLMLNEVMQLRSKKIIQTIVYMPHFISWVLMAGIIIRILAQNGLVNQLIKAFGGDPVIFLADKKSFRFILILTDIWKEFGYGSVIYLAAITGINPDLYEAAMIDGAGRIRQTWHVTLPGMLPTIVLMTALSLGRILDAGFDQVYNLYSPVVYETGDIIDTFVYRMAFSNSQFAISTAAGLFKSVISCLLIIISYRSAYVLTGYQIF